MAIGVSWLMNARWVEGGDFYGRHAVPDWILVELRDVLGGFYFIVVVD